jgi:hypothetical protein
MNRHLKRFLLILPMFLGTAGFLLSGSCGLPDALFRTLTMYVLNYGDTPPHVLVELARWLAPLATASGILMAAAALRERFRSALRCLQSDSVAVFGPEDAQARMLQALGRRGVPCGEKPPKAHRYVLLDSEENNLAYYARNRERFGGRPVYLRCEALPVQAAVGEGVTPFSVEETAARLYWKERPLYETARSAGYDLDVVLLGFGRLGEELLLRGLQANIFSPDQKLRYHVFGDCAETLAVHPGLAEIEDKVFRHDGPWYEESALLARAQRIIVLEQARQAELLRELHMLLPHAPVSVFLAPNAPARLLAEACGLDCFDWRAEAEKPENVLEDRRYLLAKTINLRYSHLYSGVDETPENRDAEWDRLDAFTRGSNISAADYHEIRLRMLAELGLPADYEALPPETAELLSELEHIRWSRYHYLNNWRFGKPESGARKDPVLRIHADLVPYEALTEPEKQKDRDNIRVLLSVPAEV